MYGSLAGALSGRKIPFDRQTYTATVEGHIVETGRTIRIAAIALHYDVTFPPESKDPALRALRVHPQGCPAHQSVQAAITITWEATLHLGDQVETVSGETTPPT